MEVLSSNAVINIFPTNPFTLICLGTSENRNLLWQSRNVTNLDDGEITLIETESSQDVNVTYDTGSFNIDRRLISISFNVNSFGLYAGYYSCMSQQSNSTIEVYTTLTNPLWRLTSPSTVTVPMGVEVTITVQYADNSTGYQNMGNGFVYNLRFLPCVATQPNLTLLTGMTDAFDNNLAHSFSPRLDDGSGEYLWNGKP